MSIDEQEVLRRFHAALVNELRERRPGTLSSPFTVAEIYQDLVPYRTHRDRIGVEMNADYEHALLRLLAGEGDYLSIESTTARQEIRDELDSPNPNTGLYRDFAAADVHLNPLKLDVEDHLTGPGEPESEQDPGSPDLEPVDSEAGAEGEAEKEDDTHGEVAPEKDPSELTGQEEDSVPGQEGVSEEEVDLPPFENCPWCREKLPQQARVRFCPFCGSNVRLVPCPECGEELRLNWRFCIACGTEVKS